MRQAPKEFSKYMVSLVARGGHNNGARHNEQEHHMKFKIGDEVSYISGWDGDPVLCKIGNVMSKADTHPLDVKTSPDDETFYMVVAEDGHGATLGESQLETR